VDLHRRRTVLVKNAKSVAALHHECYEIDINVCYFSGYT